MKAWAILFSDLCILSLQKREKESFIKTVTFLWGDTLDHIVGIAIAEYHNDTSLPTDEGRFKVAFPKRPLESTPYSVVNLFLQFDIILCVDTISEGQLHVFSLL